MRTVLRGCSLWDVKNIVCCIEPQLVKSNRNAAMNVKSYLSPAIVTYIIYVIMFRGSILTEARTNLSVVHVCVVCTFVVFEVTVACL